MVVENVFRYLFNVTLTTTVLTELTRLTAVRSCYIICVLFQRSLQLYASSDIERDGKDIDNLLKDSGTQR